MRLAHMNHGDRELPRQRCHDVSELPARSLSSSSFEFSAEHANLSSCRHMVRPWRVHGVWMSRWNFLTDRWGRLARHLPGLPLWEGVFRAGRHIEQHLSDLFCRKIWGGVWENK